MPEVDDVVLAATASLFQGCINYEGINHIPAPQVIFGGNDIPGRHMKSLQRNLLISLYDAWTFPDNFGNEWPWIPIAPIDSEPLARANVQKMGNAYKVIAMSKWGKEVMIREGIREEIISYIPHMVDTNVYRPPVDKKEAKRSLGFPEDCFLVGMVARTTKTMPANRKGYAEAFEAMAPFMSRHDNVRLYCHAPPYMGEDSADLPGMANMFGVPWDKCRALDAYAEMMGIPDQQMAEIYGAFDVYFAPSAGEGFNVPLIEAQACGVPVIANDTSAQSENTDLKSGWLVKPKTHIVTPLNSKWEVASPFGQDSTCEKCQHVTHSPGLLDALEEAYEKLGNKDALKKVVKSTRKFATDFDVQTVATRYWRPFIQEISKELA